MFPVFKKVFFLMLLQVILSSSVWAFNFNNSDAPDPMALFHEQQQEYEVIDEMTLVEDNSKMMIKVYVIDQKDPYTEPLNIKIFAKCSGGEFFKIRRSQEQQDEKTYCAHKQARIGVDDFLFGDRDRRLILPLVSYDQEKGHCQYDQLVYEAFPIRSLTRLCD